MIKRILLVAVLLGLLACKEETTSIDYFGQKEPGNTPVIFGKDLISLEGRLEHGISFTPDTQELTFGILNKEDFSGTIYYAHKEDTIWTHPEVFEPLKNKSAFLPYFSPDGNTLLYAQSATDSVNFITDIWTLKKNDDLWGQPQKIDSPISTSVRESTASMTIDNKIYFSSNRDGNGLADLYYASLENNGYSNAHRIDAICSPGDEESIFIAPDERYLILSRYASDQNGPDLYISYRDVNENWTQPIALDTTINTSQWERRPFVSIDNNFLFFTKLTFNETGLDDSDIYWVGTDAIFKPFVFNALSDITVKKGEKKELLIPSNYFKDINGSQISLSINQKGLNWVQLDNSTMTLRLSPDTTGDFQIIFTATDEFSNVTDTSVRVRVIE